MKFKIRSRYCSYIPSPSLALYSFSLALLFFLSYKLIQRMIKGTSRRDKIDEALQRQRMMKTEARGGGVRKRYREIFKNTSHLHVTRTAGSLHDSGRHIETSSSKFLKCSQGFLPGVVCIANGSYVESAVALQLLRNIRERDIRNALLFCPLLSLSGCLHVFDLKWSPR